MLLYKKLKDVQEDLTQLKDWSQLWVITNSLFYLNLINNCITIYIIGSEKERWAKSIIQLEAQVELIVGDVVMASSFVSYAGPFNKKFRN